ncbi:MAG: hypothetical protein ACYC59_06335 [Anaerolineaceae bacterium]
MKKNSTLLKKVSWSFGYGIGMALLEAVVVVYLRELYYPQGFSFPLQNMDWNIYKIEILREAGTLLMLVCVSALAAENFTTWLAYFLFNFAVWDIFYYVWLKILLNWPANLMEWDILFLIPITWDGPVLAPLLCTLAMLTLAGVILVHHKRGAQVKLNSQDWALLLSGALLVFISFIWNYSTLMLQGGFFRDLQSLGSNSAFQQVTASFVPSSFQWPLFLTGYGLIWFGIVLLATRLRKQKRIS